MQRLRLSMRYRARRRSHTIVLHFKIQYNRVDFTDFTDFTDFMNFITL